MLRTAQNYEEQLRILYRETWYDEKYKYYYASPSTRDFSLPDNNYTSHCYVSVDKDNNVLGYIGYSVDRDSLAVHSFGILSFGFSLTFARDLQQAIDDIFYKFNFNKIEFNVIHGNPAERAYRSFIKKYGGSEVGTYHKCVKLIDGLLYDSVMFELFREDYISHRNLERTKRGTK